MFGSDATRRFLLALLAVGATVGVGVSFLSRKHSEWDTVYRAAGRRLLAGESLYPPGTSYAYPPLAAALVAPLANAPDRDARLVWYLVNVAFIGGLVVLGWRAAGGTRPVVQESGVFWLGMAVGFPFVLHALAHQQVDAVVTAIVIGGCFLLARGRGIAAATCFGLAAAVKCTPLLFAPYLLVKGRPVAAAWLVLVAAGANLLPDAISRPTDATCHLEKWFDFYIAPMLKPDYAPGIWASEIIYNQSVVGAANRWFGDALPPRELKRWVYGLFAGLAALGLAAMARGRRQPNAVAWECGLVLSGMLLLSPMSSVPHFATLLLPGWLLARAVIVERRWGLLPFLVAMVLGSVMSNKDLIGSRAYTLGLWGGSVMWAAVAGFVGCAVALANWKMPQVEVAVPEVQPVRRAA
jgi:hypothetical protein